MPAGKIPADLDRSGAWIERELERLEREILIDAGGGMNRRGTRGAEERHLQTAVLLEVEAVSLRHDLADGEAEFFAPGINAAPRGGGPVRAVSGRQRRGGRLNV